jgi:NAD-dependent dihydropyrimidine dehydrogenase PreA subunit
MIEIISAARCTGCNICVYVCPVNVFDSVPDAAPVIARQGDCQTCFMCELYCPADALYVAESAERPLQVNEAELERAGMFGSYRRSIGWSKDSDSGPADDRSYKLVHV